MHFQSMRSGEDLVTLDTRIDKPIRRTHRTSCQSCDRRPHVLSRQTGVSGEREPRTGEETGNQAPSLTRRFHRTALSAEDRHRQTSTRHAVQWMQTKVVRKFLLSCTRQIIACHGLQVNPHLKRGECRHGVTGRGDRSCHLFLMSL